MISICVTCTLCLLLLSLYFPPIFLSVFFSYIFQSTYSPSCWICCYIYWLSPLPSKEIKQVNFIGNQPWIFIRSTEDEAPILWPPLVKRCPLEKTLMLARIEGRRKRGWPRMRQLDGITGSTDMRVSKLQERVKVREAWRATVYGVAKSWTRLSDWTAITKLSTQYLILSTLLFSVVFFFS